MIVLLSDRSGTANELTVQPDEQQGAVITDPHSSRAEGKVGQYRGCEDDYSGANDACSTY